MKKGFTFLELLISIGIISILVTIGLGSYSFVQKYSQDAKRKADLEEIRAAVGQYRVNNNALGYPTTVVLTVNCSYSGSFTDASGNTYLSSVPRDPRCSFYNYTYTRLSATDYTLGTYLENGGPSTGCTLTCSSTGTICNYCIGPYGVK